MYILPFKSAFGCFEGVVVYLSCIWLFWCYLAVLGVDLAFFCFCLPGNPGTAVGYAVGRRTIVVLCHAYIYTSKHIFGLCIILSCISSKKYSNLF